MPHFLFCIFSDLSMATNLKKCGFVDIKPMLAVLGYATGGITGHKKTAVTMDTLLPRITTELFTTIICQ